MKPKKREAEKMQYRLTIDEENDLIEISFWNVANYKNVKACAPTRAFDAIMTWGEGQSEEVDHLEYALEWLKK